MKLLLALLFILPMIGGSADDDRRAKYEETVKESANGRDLELIFEDPRELKKYVAEKNDARKSVAGFVNISNMHELTWDDELAKSAAAEGKSCPGRHKHGSNYRQMNLKEETETIIFLPGFRKPIDGEYLGSFELYLPLQTRFGCAVAVCDKLICNIGPHSDWKDSDIKNGLPGTGCPGAKTEDGKLCKAPAPVAVVAKTSSTPSIILAGISLISLLF